MLIWRSLLLTVALSSMSAAQVGTSTPAMVAVIDSLPETPPLLISSDACPVTAQPDPPFTPRSGLPKVPPERGTFWYGTESLWTMLPREGVWRGLHEGGRRRVFWWARGHDWQTESLPTLAVTGRRLDGTPSPVAASAARSGYRPGFGSFMHVLVDIPTTGCYELTGRYGDQTLTFVVRATR